MMEWQALKRAKEAFEARKAAMSVVDTPGTLCLDWRGKPNLSSRNTCCHWLYLSLNVLVETVDVIMAMNEAYICACVESKGLEKLNPSFLSFFLSDILILQGKAALEIGTLIPTIQLPFDRGSKSQRIALWRWSHPWIMQTTSYHRSHLYSVAWED